jgi:uncharacterized protein YkwD
MNRAFQALLWIFSISIVFLASTPTRADVLFAVRVLREGGCGGVLPSAPQLHHNALLDSSAREWAAGRGLSEAVETSGYHASSVAALHVRGPDEAMIQLLKRSGCGTLATPGLHEMGFYRRGFDAWIVLATGQEISAAAPNVPEVRPVAPNTPEARSPVPTPLPDVAVAPAPVAGPATGGLSPILATRALQLVNDVRARGARCGSEMFGPAPPVTMSTTLGGVAFGHASDMAENNYFEHEDLRGNTPSDRVRATGYKETLVGENIAYGPKSVDEVVQGWLDSPGHCENIMDPRFAEMGLGYATSHDSKHALYWVQVLAAPRKVASR